MNNQIEEARLAVQKAREALRIDNHVEARKWAEHAAALAPQMEEPWLVLAAIAEPRESMEYVQRALKINPNSPRALKGLEWAQSRLPKDSAAAKNSAAAPAQSPDPLARLPRAEFSRQQFRPLPSAPLLESSPVVEEQPKAKRSPLFPILLLIGGLLLCAIVAWSATSSLALTSMANNAAPTPSHPASWAKVVIAKPTEASSDSMAAALPSPTPEPLNLVNNLPELPTDIPTDVPTVIATDIPTDIPTGAPTLAPTDAAPVTQDTATPTVDSSGGGLTLSYVPDTPTSEVPTAAPAATPSSGSQTDYVGTGGERWIDVNLSQQMVYAYEGNTVVNSFLVSTGTWEHPTVTGQYHIYVKYRYTDMTGPGYYLPNVPYTMYFYQGYGLHGTYWHHNFGTPMSHGCVNLETNDAAWLYNWASVGTLVNVHY